MAEPEKAVQESEPAEEQPMSNEESSSSYWNVGGWLSFAKEKSKQTLDMVKRDLKEFQSTVRTDTATALTRTVDVVKQKVNQSTDEKAREAVRTNVTKLLGDVSKVVNVPPDDSDTAACVITDEGELKALDQFELRIHELTHNPDTFLTSPKRTAEFDAWNANFNVETQTQQISDILIQYTSVRKLYNELVPGKISHAEFWRNLLYRIEQLRLEQATREQLKQRASQQVATVSTSSDKWEDEEEQQTSVAPAVVQETESQKPMDSQDCVPTENVQQTAPESREIAEASGEEKQETEQAAESPVTDAPQETQPEKAKTGKAANDSQDSNDDWEKWDE